MKKIIVTNATKSVKQVGDLHESGLIVFENGEISHVLFEKQFNKCITEFKEPPKEESKVDPAVERSKSGRKKKEV